MNGANKKTYTLTVAPDLASVKDAKRYYSNFISVGHDPFSFILSFCVAHFETADPANIHEKDHTGALIVRAPIVAQIAIPSGLMESFISACQENLAKFRDNVSKPDKDHGVDR